MLHRFFSCSFLLIALTFSAINLSAQEKASLNIAIDGMKSNKGYIHLAVHNSESTYPDRGLPVYTKSIRAREGMVELNLTAIQPGSYAITVFHDVNGNMKLDKNLVGIPSEPFGFSNNVMTLTGPPSFKAAKIVLLSGESRKVRISLREI